MFLPCQDPNLPSGDFGVHRYQGHVSAALVLGGVDFNGPHLFTVRSRSLCRIEVRACLILLTNGAACPLILLRL